MLFVCHPEILHKHCLEFLLGVKKAPRETQNNAYAKFGETNKEHYGMLCYFLEGQLYTLVFRPRQLWIGGGEGAYFFCLEETGVGRKS